MFYAICHPYLFLSKEHIFLSLFFRIYSCGNVLFLVDKSPTKINCLLVCLLIHYSLIHRWWIIGEQTERKNGRQSFNEKIMNYHRYMGQMNIQIHTTKIKLVNPVEIRLDLFLTKKDFFQLIKFKNKRKSQLANRELIIQYNHTINNTIQTNKFSSIN